MGATAVALDLVDTEAPMGADRAAKVARGAMAGMVDICGSQFRTRPMRRGQLTSGLVTVVKVGSEAKGVTAVQGVSGSEVARRGSRQGTGGRTDHQVLLLKQPTRAVTLTVKSSITVSSWKLFASLGMEMSSMQTKSCKTRSQIFLR
jgi:hypothetical protein